MKNSNFYRGTTYPKFELLVQLWPQYTPWRWWKSKITIRLSKSIKMEALSPLNFQWKPDFFLNLGYFGSNGSRIKDQGSINKKLLPRLANTSEKLEIQFKKVMHFSFDFGWYSIHLDIVHEELGVRGVA